MSDDIVLEGSTGQIYYPETFTFRKKVGTTPTFQFVVPDDDLDRVAAEDYFRWKIYGATKFKGLTTPELPPTFDLNAGTMSITLNDYLYKLALNFDLVNAADIDFVDIEYRLEFVNELVDTIADALRIVCIGRPNWVYFFGVTYVPPQYISSIRYEFENRTNALIRLAAATKYGTDAYGVLTTNPDDLCSEEGVCDIWLDYDVARTISGVSYPGSLIIGVLGAKQIGTDTWSWVTNDVTNDLLIESLSQLQYTLHPPSTVYVIGAGDGLNQIVGKATAPKPSDFEDNVYNSDKFEKLVYYLPQWDRPSGTGQWLYEPRVIVPPFLNVIKGYVGVDGGYSCLNINVGQVYNSPTIKVDFEFNEYATGDLGAGVYVYGDDTDNYYYLFITPTHYQWILRSIGTDAVICEGDKTFISGIWHTLELYVGTWDQQIYCAIDGEELFWLNEAWPSILGDDLQVGLIVYAQYAGHLPMPHDMYALTDECVMFRKISVHDNQNVSPCTIITDSKYVNCLSAYKEAERQLRKLNASRSFSIDIVPDVFLDGKIDIGQQVTISDKYPTINGTYRIDELVLTESKCTVSLVEVPV